MGTLEQNIKSLLKDYDSKMKVKVYINNYGINGLHLVPFFLKHADPTSQPTNGNREEVVCVLFHKPCQVGPGGWRTSQKN